jgi:hypothetical protein
MRNWPLLGKHVNHKLLGSSIICQSGELFSLHLFMPIHVFFKYYINNLVKVPLLLLLHHRLRLFLEKVNHNVNKFLS